jgi:hypothetical protein
MALALGVYGRRIYRDLLIIKNIRNAFAHSAESMDFEHAEVAKLCKDLWFPQKISCSGYPAPATSKELFIRAIELLTDGLYGDLNRRKKGLPPTSS